MGVRALQVWIRRQLLWFGNPIIWDFCWSPFGPGRIFIRSRMLLTSVQKGHHLSPKNWDAGRSLRLWIWGFLLDWAALLLLLIFRKPSDSWLEGLVLSAQGHTKCQSQKDFYLVGQTGKRGNVWLPLQPGAWSLWPWIPRVYMDPQVPCCCSNKALAVPSPLLILSTVPEIGWVLCSVLVWEGWKWLLKGILGLKVACKHRRLGSKVQEASSGPLLLMHNTKKCGLPAEGLSRHLTRTRDEAPLKYC